MCSSIQGPERCSSRNSGKHSSVPRHFDSVVLMPCIHNRQNKLHSKMRRVSHVMGARDVSGEIQPTWPPVGNRQLTTPTIGSNHTRCSKVTDVHFRECAVIRANARLSSHNLWASVVGNSEVHIIDWLLNVRHSLCHTRRRLPPKACWFALRASGSGQLETSV